MLNESFIPPVKGFKHIVVHWTAGGYKANAKDKASYHFLIEGDGNVVYGDNKITNNIPPLKTGKYAAHTKNLNSYSIGVSCCSMAGATESPLNYGSAPLTKVQWEKMIQVVAFLAKRYGIPVSDQTILTHAEVQPNLGIKQNNKWDITVLQFAPAVKGHRAVGDKMRKEIKEAQLALSSTPVKKNEDVVAPVKPAPTPTTQKKYTVRQVQQALRNFGIYIDVDGILGPRTVQAIKIFQKLSGLEQTGQVDSDTAEKLLD